MGMLQTITSGSYVPTSGITTVLREQLEAVVTNNDPFATPLLDMFSGGFSIESPVYQWVVDELPPLVLSDTSGTIDVAGINVQGLTEGFDATFGAYPYTGQPRRLTNFIQTFGALVKVTDTLKNARSNIIRDPYNAEAVKAGQVIKKAKERRLFDNISANANYVQGSAGPIHRMYGLFEFTTTTAGAGNFLISQTTANGTLTPAMIDAAVETVVSGSTGSAGSSVIPTVLAVSLGVKYDLSSQLRTGANNNSIGGSPTMYQGTNQSMIGAQEKRIIRNIDVYEGDGAELMITWSRQIPQGSATTSGGKAWLIAPEMIEYGDYTAMHHVPLAKTGYNTQGMIVCESGYKLKNPKAIHVINNVTT